MDKPWKWVEDGKAELTAESGELKTYVLIPTSPERVEQFRKALALARDVSTTLGEAHRAFRTGRVSYAGAAKKIRSLLIEWTVALNSQLDAAMQISAFTLPDTVARDFHWHVEAITLFAFEAVEQLAVMAAKAEKARSDAASPESVIKLEPMPEPEPEPVAVSPDGQPEG